MLKMLCAEEDLPGETKAPEEQLKQQTADGCSKTQKHSPKAE